MSGNASNALNDPQALAALQSQLANNLSARTDSDNEDTVHIHYPPEIKRRIAALRKLQNESMQVEAEFYKAVCDLEIKYAEKFQPLYDRRHEIVAGKVEPTDEEASWQLPSEVSEKKSDEAGLASGVEQLKLNAGGSEQSAETKVSGIPGFWLRVFKNVQLISDMVQSHDEPILEKLDDVVIIMHPITDPGFTIEFRFSENDHFTNTVLTKDYKMKVDVEKDDPFSYEGPEIIACTGCTIDWKKGKNVTVKTIKKVQKHKKGGQRRTVSKQVKNDSFFNFFDPPKMPDTEAEQSSGANDDLDSSKLEETEALLSADFEIGHFLRDRVVPRAILYFTGEALDEDDDEDYDDDVEEEDDDDHDDDDEDDDDDE